MKLDFSKLLSLMLIQGGIVVIFSMPNNEKTHVIPSSEDNHIPYVRGPVKAILPSPDNVKKRRSLRKRETGRAVDISSEEVERMAKVPTAALSCELPENQETILDTHNRYRSQADPPACNMLKLVWNREAAEKALLWAKQCQGGHSPQSMKQITDFKCGENVFQSAFRVSWGTVVDSWFSEKIDFRYGIGAIVKREIGHFTQGMWATSGYMGCGVAECPNSPNKFIYVCHYCPAGNSGSRAFPWKKGTSCSDCSKSCETNLCTNRCPYQNNYGNCRDFISSCPLDPSMKSKCPAACQCTNGEIY
ncbi:serotriflin-like [Engystomops pustulosus]|uniref:serotriflin-like n=1 Tax=Engystomops pustulosus TaxID=76066 RepID=UPI003AFAF2EF